MRILDTGEVVFPKEVIGPSGIWGQKFGRFLWAIINFAQAVAAKVSGVDYDMACLVGQNIAIAVSNRKLREPAFLDACWNIPAYIRTVAWREATRQFGKVKVELRPDQIIGYCVAICEDWMNPEYRVRNREIAEILETAMRRMPKKRRQYFVMVRLDGMTYLQAAKATKTTEDNVKWHVVQAGKDLKAVFKRYGIVPSRRGLGTPTNTPKQIEEGQQ